jgi:hypothetical protein
MIIQLLELLHIHILQYSYDSKIIIVEQPLPTSNTTSEHHHVKPVFSVIISVIVSNFIHYFTKRNSENINGKISVTPTLNMY